MSITLKQSRNVVRKLLYQLIKKFNWFLNRTKHETMLIILAKSL